MVVLISEKLCAGCGECVPYCVVGALSVADGTAVVDEDRCVECHLCVRFDVCPVGAISSEEDDHPRSVRRISDPTLIKATGIPGRGTEEVKTNDVTGRVGRGQLGFCIELGRPGVSTSLADLEKVTAALVELGITFQRDNPTTSFLANPQRGLVDEELKKERVLSLIVEFVTGVEMLEPVISRLREAAEQVDTVFSVGLITRVDDDGSIPVLKDLEDLGIPARGNSKVNLGLGRPLFGEGSGS